MNQKAALCKALLDGRTVNIKNGFEWFGITNIPREIGRSIDRSFGVKTKKIPREGLSRYKQPCTWMDYRLEITEENMEGIKKMKEYVKSQIEKTIPKTDAEIKNLKKLNLL